MRRVLVAGCGWLGQAVARTLLARGERVVGLRRSAEGARGLAALGVEPLALDLAAAGAAAALPGEIDAVVACPAAGSADVATYERTYLRAMGTLLERYAGAGLEAFVYTGSTGVFGQADGRVVDEHTPPLPAGPTSVVLAQAERAVLDRASAGDVPGRVVRLSGLYGPGRFGVIERVRSGRLALGADDGAWMNFCHLDDAVRTVVAALDRGAPGAVYHASDAAPARRREVVSWIAARAGIAPPSRDGAATSNAASGRRVSAAWSRERLCVELIYASFREGLEAAFSPAP